MRNLILKAMPRMDSDRIAEELESLELEKGQVLHEADRTIDYIFFPSSAVVSLVVPLDRRRRVEASTVGNEGLIGLPALFGDGQHHQTALAQIPGRAHRTSAAAFQRAMHESPSLTELVHRYTMAQMEQLAQSVACSRMHSVRQRMCRWLLMCHDRVGADEFPLTHEFLAAMLAVQRTTVSETAAKLQAAGMIKYKWGRITIRDRQGLERASCECHAVTTALYQRLLRI